MKVNFDALNEGRLQYPHEEKAMRLIVTVVKNVFGNELEYIVHPEVTFSLKTTVKNGNQPLIT